MNTFSDPRKIIEQLSIMPGQKIADFGVGSGAYALQLAEKTKSSDQSMVYAIDIQKDLLEKVMTQAGERKLTNIQSVWGDIERDDGSRLRDESVNWVVLTNILFQVEDRSAVLKEAHRILAKNGSLLVVDWSESFGNIGPSTTQVIDEITARSLVESAGFAIDRPIEAGEHHYGFVATKS
jgi:ubiquinone/menaquinone biosynthesis C-methylase UbiE